MGNCPSYVWITYRRVSQKAKKCKEPVWMQKGWISEDFFLTVTRKKGSSTSFDYCQDCKEKFWTHLNTTLMSQNHSLEVTTQSLPWSNRSKPLHQPHQPWNFMKMHHNIPKSPCFGAPIHQDPGSLLKSDSVEAGGPTRQGHKEGWLFPQSSYHNGSRLLKSRLQWYNVIQWGMDIKVISHHLCQAWFPTLCATVWNTGTMIVYSKALYTPNPSRSTICSNFTAACAFCSQATIHSQAPLPVATGCCLGPNGKLDWSKEVDNCLTAGHAMESSIVGCE